MRSLASQFAPAESTAGTPLAVACRVTILEEPCSTHDAEEYTSSGSLHSYILREKLPLGTPVRIEKGDEILLGDVAFAVVHERGFICGVTIEQSLRSVSSLRNLVKSLSRSSEPPHAR